MVNTVIEFEDDRRIAWQTRPPSFLGSALRRPDLALRARARRPTARASASTWDISQEKGKQLVFKSAKQTAKAMEKTLERIDDLVDRMTPPHGGR